MFELETLEEVNRSTTGRAEPFLGPMTSQRHSTGKTVAKGVGGGGPRKTTTFLPDL